MKTMTRYHINEKRYWSTRHCELGKEVTCWFLNAEKTKLVSIDWSNNTVATDVKMDGSIHEGKSPFKMLGSTFSSKSSWGSYIISIAKTPSGKLEPWFVLWSFFLLGLLCISKNLLQISTYHTVVMSGLVFLAATYKYYIRYKNRHVGLLVLHLTLSWTLGSSLICSYLTSFL